MINKIYFDKVFRLTRSVLDQAGEFNRSIISMNIHDLVLIIAAEIIANTKTDMIDDSKN